MFKIAAVFALLIAVEAYFGLNGLIGWAVWAVSWLPTTAGWMLALAALIGMAVLVALFGWVGVGLIGFVAMWPVFGVSLGFLDHLFFGWAHHMVNDSTDPQEVVGRYNLLHYGTLAIFVGLVVAAGTWVMHKVFG